MKNDHATAGKYVIVSEVPFKEETKTDSKRKTAKNKVDGKQSATTNADSAETETQEDTTDFS